MRLLAALASAVAALSSFGAGVCAFTQPRGAARPVAPLQARPVTNADYDLSGMLTDYSGTAAPKAAAKIAEKAAEVVAPVVAAPPPPVPVPVAAPVVDVSDVAESSMEALSKAASAAQEAADQAAAAAAVVASKGAAATKAVTAAGVAGGVQLKPLLGGVFVRVDPAKVNTDQAFDAKARATENLARLKANFLQGVDYFKESADSIKGATGDLGSASPSLDTPNLSPAVADIVASLHLQEYGAWYAAGFLAILASQQRSAGKAEASAAFETELADAKTRAAEAASAAGAAAAGAQTAKKLAMQMEKDLQKDGGQALLESSRNKMVQMEKDMMEKEMRSLKAEISSLKSQLAKVDDSKKKPTATKTVAKTEIEEEYPTKVVVDTGADEDGRIIELLKEIDEENKAKKAAELERRREEEAKFVAAQKGKEAAQATAKGAEAAPKKKAAAKKAKKAATKAKAVAKKKVASKVAAKQAPKKAPAVVAAGSSDDWATLAESTLKRKTVAQLTEYLTGKGVSVTDGSGKPLKKSELLDAVKSL